jgi:hypothetical protein
MTFGFENDYRPNGEGSEEICGESHASDRRFMKSSCIEILNPDGREARDKSLRFSHRAYGCVEIDGSEPSGLTWTNGRDVRFP